MYMYIAQIKYEFHYISVMSSKTTICITIKRGLGFGGMHALSRGFFFLISVTGIFEDIDVYHPRMCI